MGWQPATIEEVVKLTTEQLMACSADEITVFRRYEVPPFDVPIRRYGESGTVVAVAKKDNEVLFWEDYECGFVISPISTDGIIEEYNFNQDTLSLALRHWTAN